jgi:ABC-2 type transport system permease protein
VVPLLAAGIFAFLVLTTSGYMMEVVVEEKENRTIEVVISSISPGQMMAGKIAGAIGIALLQLAVWVAFLAGAAWLGANVLGVRWLQDMNVNWRDAGLIAAVALPTFVCIAALMTAVGASLAEAQDAQQITPFVFLALLLPLYLAIPLAKDPGSPLAIGLSLFPVTSVTTLAVRSLFCVVPAWQFWLSAAVSLVCAAGAVCLAGAALRVGMLRYGKRLKWRDLLRRRGTRSVSA